MSILDTIDNAIADYELSSDAMRWTPEPPTDGVPVVPGQTYEMSAWVNPSPGGPDFARLFDVPPGFVASLDGWPGPALEPWQAEALRRIGQHIEAAATQIGEQLSQAIKGASLTFGWIDEVQWDRRRRPERVTRMRQSYRTKRGRRW